MHNVSFRSKIVCVFLEKVKTSSVQPALLVGKALKRIRGHNDEAEQFRARIGRLYHGIPVKSPNQYKWYNTMLNTHMCGHMNSVYANFNIAWRNARHGNGVVAQTIESSVCIALKEKYKIKIPMSIKGHIDLSFIIPSDEQEKDIFAEFWDSSNFINIKEHRTPDLVASFYVYFMFEPTDSGSITDENYVYAKENS